MAVGGGVWLCLLSLGLSSPESSAVLSAGESVMTKGAPGKAGTASAPAPHVLASRSAGRPVGRAGSYARLGAEVRGIAKEMCLGRSVSNLPVAPSNPPGPRGCGMQPVRPRLSTGSGLPRELPKHASPCPSGTNPRPQGHHPQTGCPAPIDPSGHGLLTCGSNVSPLRQHTGQAHRYPRHETPRHLPTLRTGH